MYCATLARCPQATAPSIVGVAPTARKWAPAGLRCVVTLAQHLRPIHNAPRLRCGALWLDWVYKPIEMGFHPCHSGAGTRVGLLNQGLLLRVCFLERVSFN